MALADWLVVAVLCLISLAVGLIFTRRAGRQVGGAPPGFRLLQDPAYAWGELVRLSRLPAGFTGVLVAAEAAAFMSTLSAPINWGSSFIINDYYRPLRPEASPKSQVVVSRLATLLLFLLAASILGLPLSILFWFVLGFEHRPFWQSTGFLFLLSLALLIAVSLLTPPESEETLVRFYERCRPPGLWKKIRPKAAPSTEGGQPIGHLVVSCLLGIASCLGLVVMTNSLFAGDWTLFGLGGLGFGLFGYWLINRIFVTRNIPSN